MRTNKYAGKCNSCKTSVPDGKGFVYKNGHRWFCVCASRACMRHLGLKDPDVAVVEQKRFITEEGRVYMPYDSEALGLLRSMPGARWNPDDPNDKHWTVSTDTGDLARIIEVAGQLNMDVPESFRERAEAGTAESRDAKKRAGTQGLYDFQRYGVEFLALHKRAFLADDMGLGKQHNVDTLVATPKGWQTIGSLSRGDFVIGSNGRPTVVAGVFPQGIKPSYRLHFSDGSSVEAGPEHLWTVAYRAGGRRWQEITVTTDQLRTGATITQSWDNGRITQINLAKTRLYLPMLSAPIDWESGKDLPLPAYFVGQLITNASTAHGTPKLATRASDWGEVSYQLRKCGIKASSCRQYGSVVQATFSNILAIIRNLGIDVLSRNKRIPNGYLIASIDDRCALLHGLMDADGSCSKKRNKLTYHTISNGLANDIVSLVESLGGIASIREYDRSHENRPKEYQVRIRIPAWISPFTISRKKNRYNPGSHAGPCRVFVKAEYVRDVESVCISVGAEDRLYVTERCILTHNTVQALVALPKNARAIVICPAAVKFNWQDEAKKWRPDLKTFVLKGRKSFALPEEGEILVTNYDILPALLKKVEDIPEDVKAILSQTILIADEAHLCKNYKTQRSKKVGTLSRICSKVWFLSGTPLMNRPQDLFGVMCAGDMNVFGRWAKFVSLFNGWANSWGGYEWGDPKREVPERLKRVMLRRLKCDVLKDLPPKTYQTITVDIDGKLKNKLDKAWENWDEDRPNNGLPSFEEFSKLRAMLAKSRISATIEVIESYEESNIPLIVFSAHKAPVEEIGQRDGWAVITGDTDPLARRNLVKDFQEGMLKGLALTIKAGGVGLTLTRAHHILFIDLDWTPAWNIQAEDRVCRIGQTANTIIVQQMQSNHSLDKHVQALIANKMRMIQKALHEKIQYTAPDKKNVVVPQLVDESDEALAARLALIEEAAAEVDREWFRNKVHRILEREQSKTQIPEPELTEERKDLLEGALEYMLGQCDGAMTKDKQGFNRPDAAIAHWIGKTGMKRDDDLTYRVLERILSRYSRQLNDKYGAIWSPE